MAEETKETKKIIPESKKKHKKKHKKKKVLLKVSVVFLLLVVMIIFPIDSDDARYSNAISCSTCSSVVAQLVQMRITVCVSSAFSMKPRRTLRCKRSDVALSSVMKI